MKQYLWMLVGTFFLVACQEQEGDYIQLLMNPKDIAVFTKSLVDQGLVPVNIKTQTILQQTYFKMSR